MNVSLGVCSLIEGVLIENQMPLPAPVHGLALIDTGAPFSAIDNELVVKVLRPQGQGPVRSHTVMGEDFTAESYIVRFSFPGLEASFNQYGVIGMNLSKYPLPDRTEPFIALVGRDILAQWLLVYDGPNSTFSITT